MKFHPTTTGLAISDTGPLPAPYDAIRLVLSLPAGKCVINELGHDAPYRHGLFRNRLNPHKPASVICPYCSAQVLLYEYPELEFCMFICKEIAVFMRLPADRLSLEDWAHLVRGPARVWTEVEAAEKGGPHGGQN